MKRIFSMLAVGMLLLGMTACKKQSAADAAHSPQNSLDWVGTYEGVVPCADCEGIKIRLVLNEDNTYTKRMEYQGKATIVAESGSFEWNKKGSQVTLSPESELPSEGMNQFKVEENRVVMLDTKGKEITGELAGNYILLKKNFVTDEGLYKYWKLVELQGKPVTYDEKSTKEAFMILKADGNVNGNFACNSFHGSYEVEAGNRISFSQMASTMMMCLNMEIENEFSKVLNTADNYNLNNDTLVLNRARMAPLARFEAVYMQ